MVQQSHGLGKEKLSFLSTYRNLHFWHHMCGGFPHQAVLQFSVDTIWMSYNSIQSWHCLRGVSTDPTGLGLSFIRRSILNPRWSPVFLNNCLYIGGSHSPLLPFNNLLEQLTEPRVTVYLLDYRFIIKGDSSGTAGWKMHRVRYLERDTELHTLFRHVMFPAPPNLHWPGSFPNPVANDFYGGFLR